ncbi:hypothetical protein CDV55_107319 [Aspergillus turcosus]|uniref:Uncharacterized protein n=1 Tax=Aspergillus turcosus TaxID=1245748 RepID=A0A397IBU4_9EURO|nr:hypothetical protein CDV55_107319 [Aspergillus turcosus]RLM01570.1 hypothetical protein CFD26_108822 [Aspergillus turcosus]
MISKALRKMYPLAEATEHLTSMSLRRGFAHDLAQVPNLPCANYGRVRAALGHTEHSEETRTYIGDKDITYNKLISQMTNHPGKKASPVGTYTAGADDLHLRPQDVTDYCQANGIDPNDITQTQRAKNTLRGIKLQEYRQRATEALHEVVTNQVRAYRHHGCKHFLAKTNKITAVKHETPEGTESEATSSQEKPEASQPWKAIPISKIPTTSSFNPIFGGKRSFIQETPASQVIPDSQPSSPDPIQDSFASYRSPTVETQHSQSDDDVSGELPLGPESPFNPRKTIRPGQALPANMAEPSGSGKQRAHTTETEEVEEMLFSPAQIQALQRIVRRAIQASLPSLNAQRPCTPVVEERTTPVSSTGTASTDTNNHWRPADIGYFYGDMTLTTITGVPIILPFEALYERPRSPTERDITITMQMSRAESEGNLETLWVIFKLAFPFSPQRTFLFRT